jgi:SAM-dependent methyltransferase
MTDATVREAYTARADEYAALLGSMDAVHDEDRRLIEGWAASLDGPILDVGCGPGHWTGHLADAGADVEGLDPVPAFVDIARTLHPSARFRVASAGTLGVPAGSVAGILAWYSLIHLEPPRMAPALAELARALREGGSLVIGFVRGEVLEPFDHAVTTAYRWPVEAMRDRLAGAGFTVEAVQTRDDPDRRPHAAIVARRRGASRRRT